MKNTKKRNTKNALLLLTGAIAGAAATYYLHTPKGKQMSKNIVEKGKDIGNSISDGAQTIVQEVKESTNKAIAIASDKLDQTKESIIEQTSSLLEKSEKKNSNFKDGITKAKKAIVNGDLVS